MSNYQLTWQYETCNMEATFTKLSNIKNCSYATQEPAGICCETKTGYVALITRKIE
jgi:hypothetical protein